MLNYTPGGGIGEVNYRPQKRVSELKRILALVVILVISTYCTGIVAGVVFSLVYSISGYSYGELYVLDSIYEMFVYVCNLLVPAALYIMARKVCISQCFDLSDLTEKKERVSLLSVMRYFLCAFTLSCAMSYLTSFFSLPLGFDSEVFDTATASTFSEYILDIIAIAVLPALLEEFFFRGILLRVLLPFGKSFAIVTSAVFFASAHGSLEQISYSFVYGLFFALIAVKTGSLTTGIIIHFLNNAFSCTIDFAGKLLPEGVFNVLVGTLTVFMIAAGLIITVYLIGKGSFDIVEKEDRDEKALTVREAFSAYLSPAVISYGIFVISETVVSYIWR